MKQIPKTIELKQQIQADIENKLGLEVQQIPKPVIEALSSVLAAQFKLCYLYFADLQNNLFPDTADTFEDGGELNRLGQIYLNRQPKPATNGIFKISLTGIPGSYLRSGLTFKSNEDSKNPGKLFVLDNEYYLTGNDDFVQVRSFESGLNSSLNVNDQLTITEPVIGVEKFVVVNEIIEEPLSSESIDNYRQAIINAIQLEPQGGSRTDYRLWSSDAQGVRNVYPYVKQNDSGTIQVFVEAEIPDSVDGEGTPSQQILDSVRDVILFDPDETKPVNERGRIPMNTVLEVLPITLVPVRIEIVSLNTNNAAISSSIEDSVRNYLRGIRPFIDGADLLRNKNNTLNSARVQGVVADTLDNTNFFLDFKMYVDGNQENFYTFGFSNIPYLESIVYS